MDSNKQKKKKRVLPEISFPILPCSVETDGQSPESVIIIRKNFQHLVVDFMCEKSIAFKVLQKVYPPESPFHRFPFLRLLFNVNFHSSVIDSDLPAVFRNIQLSNAAGNFKCCSVGHLALKKNGPFDFLRCSRIHALAHNLNESKKSLTS